jgi:hypothetical protein
MPRTSEVAVRSNKPCALKDYKNASAEYRRLMNYLKAATSVLPKAECELLSEFAEISKRKCQRLRRALDRQPVKHRSAA